MLLNDLTALAPPFELVGVGTADPMLPPSLIVAVMLIENLSIGSLPTDDSALPIFVSHEPNKPVECITVYDTPGVEEVRGMRGDVVMHHGIQIRVRGRNFSTIWQRLNNINTALLAVDSVAVDLDGNIMTVQAMTSTSAIVPLGPTSPRGDDVFVKNYIATITND